MVQPVGAIGFKTRAHQEELELNPYLMSTCCAVDTMDSEGSQTDMVLLSWSWQSGREGSDQQGTEHAVMKDDTEGHCGEIGFPEEVTLRPSLDNCELASKVVLLQ